MNFYSILQSKPFFEFWLHWSSREFLRDFGFDFKIIIKKIEQILKNPRMVAKIADLQKVFVKEICSEFANSFWDRKSHIIDLPYIDGFDEKAISKKARPIQMNHELMEI